MNCIEIEEGYTLHTIKFDHVHKGVELKVHFTQTISHVTKCGHYNMVLLDGKGNVVTTQSSSCGAPEMKTKHDLQYDIIPGMFRHGIGWVRFPEDEKEVDRE